MKYSLSVNQKSIIDSGFDIDLFDGILIDFMKSFLLSDDIQKKMLGNKVFGWFKYSHIVNELPLLKLKKDSVYRRIKKMIDIGLLEAHPDNQITGKSYFYLTKKVQKLYFDKGKEPDNINPTPPLDKSEPPTDCDTDNNNTNDSYIREFDIKGEFDNSPTQSLFDDIIIPLKTSKNKKEDKPPKQIKPKDEATIIFNEIKSYWKDEFHKGWTFEAMHGHTLKQLIGKIRRILTTETEKPDNSVIFGFFKVICQNLPEWYKEKDLNVLNSKFNELITEINNNQNGKQQQKSTGMGYDPSKSKYAPKR